MPALPLLGTGNSTGSIALLRLLSIRWQSTPFIILVPIVYGFCQAAGTNPARLGLPVA